MKLIEKCSFFFSVLRVECEDEMLFFLDFYLNGCFFHKSLVSNNVPR